MPKEGYHVWEVTGDGKRVLRDSVKTNDAANRAGMDMTKDGKTVQIVKHFGNPDAK